MTAPAMGPPARPGTDRRASSSAALHTLTPAQVAALNIPGVQGGMLGLNVQKDNELYSLALRPLLPDETS